ncbi:unnamed protein product [Boreogadus saida]
MESIFPYHPQSGVCLELSKWVNQGRPFRSSGPDTPPGYGGQKPCIWIISCTHGGAPRWEPSRKSRTCAEEPLACAHPTADVSLPCKPRDVWRV